MLKVSKHPTIEEDTEEQTESEESAYLWFDHAEYTGALLTQQT